MITNTSCSSRGPEFGFTARVLGASHKPVTLAPENLIPLASMSVSLTYTRAHVHTLTHIIKKHTDFFLKPGTQFMGMI